MKIAILNNQAFFVRGGAEVLADSLKLQLERYGHQAEVIRIPFRWYPPENILSHMFASRLLKLEAAEADLVIALKFPAYMMPFHNKKLWLLHQFRQVYDLWGTPFHDFPNTPEALRIRDIIIQADNRYLREVREIYTNSKIVASRLKQHNNIDATAVLYPPLPKAELFHEGKAENYFFYPSRITKSKRQLVAVEAMRYVKSDFKLVLAGKADNDAEDREIRAKIEQLGLKNRVEMYGYISDERKADLMAKAVGCLYIPYNEDSYGYVTLEAFHSRKPVITFTDSGGTEELIEHEVNGMIVPPTPQDLADAMERMWSNRSWTAELGEQAYETLNKHHINWDYVIERLLS